MRLPSGLLACTLIVTGSPGWTVLGLAEHATVGFCGCFTVNDAVQAAEFNFFPLGSVTFDLIVYLPGARLAVSIVAELP